MNTTSTPHHGAMLEQLESRTLLSGASDWTQAYQSDRLIQDAVQGDFDGDGRADVVLTRATELTFLRNLGNGSYDQPRTLRLNANIGTLAKGRLNGDTAPDLVSTVTLANGNTLVRTLFFDRAAGTFVTGPRLVIPASEGVLQDVKALDLTGDVRSEILVNVGNSVRLLAMPNKTRIVDNGVVFSDPAPWSDSSPQGRGTRSLTVGDIDSNGRADLIVSYQGYIGVQPVSAAFSLSSNANRTGVIARTSPLPASLHLIIADFNNDGIKDGVWNNDGKVFIANGLGGGEFDTPTVVYNDSRRITSLEGFADMNSDGRPEIIAFAYQRQLIVDEGYWEEQRRVSILSPTIDGPWTNEIVGGELQDEYLNFDFAIDRTGWFLTNFGINGSDNGQADIARYAFKSLTVRPAPKAILPPTLIAPSAGESTTTDSSHDHESNGTSASVAIQRSLRSSDPDMGAPEFSRIRAHDNSVLKNRTAAPTFADLYDLTE